MSAHIFSESGQMQEVDIPDIFDVLEGGEDENAVKYLLGFGGPDEQGNSSSSINIQQHHSNTMMSSEDDEDDASMSSSGLSQTPRQVVISSLGPPAPARRRDTSGAKAIYHCQNCRKAFTTKFNLKRHINMHCHRSRELGVPVQGPPSASAPTKKGKDFPVTSGLVRSIQVVPSVIAVTTTHSLPPSSLTYQVGTGATTATVRMMEGHNATPNVNPSQVSNQVSQTPCQPRTVVHGVEAPSQSDTHLLQETSVQAIQDIQPSLSPPHLMISPNERQTISTNLSQIQPQKQVFSVVSTVSPSSVSSSSSNSNVSNAPVSNTLTNLIPVTASSAESTPLLQTVSSHLQQLGVTAASFQVTISPSDGDLSVQLPSELFENLGGETAFNELLNRNQNLTETDNIGGGKTGFNETKTIVLKAIRTLPTGWLRKPILNSEKGQVSIFYYNPSGKKFSSMDEIKSHFIRLGFAVCPNVFDFEVHDSDYTAVAYSQPNSLSRQSSQQAESSQEDTKEPDTRDARMPPKRQLSTSEDSKDGMENRRSATPEPGKKRKKIDPQQQMQALYDFLRKYKCEDGSELCEPFIRAPKRRTDPAYFEVVSDPIDMLRIQQKLKTDEYADLDELKADFDKLIDNALKYYSDESDEKTAANEMKDLLDKALEKIEAGEDPVATLGSREESDESDLTEMLEDLFAACITAMDPQDSTRALHTVFRLLPSQKRYPEYYEVIKEPIDLKMIATKIQNGDYEALSELEDDLNTMFRNAISFNEPGSQIYKDAKTLIKLVKTKKYELEVNKLARENRGSRSTRRLQGKKHFSAEISELQYEDSESEESEDENVDMDDPLWALYTHVRHFQTPSGIELAAPFLTLPSKRELPDYYAIVEEPISLNQIHKKMKNGEYPELKDLARDLSLMFENCKIYNRPDSRLYKDGVKLQKIFQTKLEELQMDDEDDEGDSNQGKTFSPKVSKDPMKKRLRMLYNAVLNYKNRDGIEIVGMFMEKPSRKEYPDYYEVISNPMDMNTINDRIKNNIYTSEEDLIQDMRLMFSNCRTYNEEGSAIYEDANVLERVLLSKARDMGIVQRKGPNAKGLMRRSTKIVEKMRTLFETLRDHKDAKGRQLSLIFLKLPNPKEFPDYFEVISHPVDFELISMKIKQGKYSSMEDCLNDFILMFDNACKYNEPDSQIYKDALTLQNLAHCTFRTLMEDDKSMPDVPAAVQEILSHIFISMYNHQDSDERCYSDCLAELPEHDEVEGKKIRALSLDLIKQRLDRGLYKRLDVFQKDIFAVLERARNLSRSDSQVFEDATELQLQFIRVRDETCGHGDVLQSTALMYTASDLMKSVEALKQQKTSTELPEEQGSDASKTANQESSTTTATFNQQEYIVGEFVYVASSEEKDLAHNIYQIENIFTKNGEQCIYGNQFFRPVQTYHVSTRKFLENEVFKSDVHESVPLSKTTGRCMVLPLRTYLRYKPENFNDDDVFVCESKYQSKARSFKKLKGTWQVPEHINLIQREEELEPKRVPSVFRERIEKHKEELEEIEAMVNKIEEELPPNVLWECENAQPGQIFYEQYTIPGPITLRRGDFVYVRAENGKNLIAQIEKMWTAEDMAYFHGPWYVTPKEMPPQPDGIKFYKQEALLSTISDSNPLLSVVGKCHVMELKDYMTQRPTQFAEDDVYVCESVYDESKRVVQGPLPNGMKQFEHSANVISDEIYFFKHPINVQKESHNAPTPANKFSSSMDIDNEDSLDAPPSVSSVETTSTPSQKKVKGPAKKNVTPYILFSSEVRKSISEQNKASSFGEISRIVGEKWKQLSDAEKQIYEEKARKLNEENAIKFAEEQKAADDRRRQENAAASATVVSVGSNQHLRQNQSGPQGQAVRHLSGGGQVAQASPGQIVRHPSHSVSAASISKPVEPIFHTVPPRPQRLLHSEAYIRYIEGLTADSQTMSNWERQLTATKTNTRTDEAKLPAHWLADNGEHGTSLDALWALRDFMMTDALFLTKL